MELTGLARKVMHAAYGAHQLSSIRGAEPEERRVRRETYEATMGCVIEENDEFSLLTGAKLHEVEKRYRVITANGLYLRLDGGGNRGRFVRRTVR